MGSVWLGKAQPVLYLCLDSFFLYGKHLSTGCSFPALQTLSFRAFVIRFAGGKLTYMIFIFIFLVVCLRISHPLDGREQGKVTEGVSKLIPTDLI